MSRENAEEMENELIARYQQKNGKPPKYNKSKTSLGKRLIDYNDLEPIEKFDVSSDDFNDMIRRNYKKR
jgi:hypothetical protein